MAAATVPIPGTVQYSNTGTVQVCLQSWERPPQSRTACLLVFVYMVLQKAQHHGVDEALASLHTSRSGAMLQLLSYFERVSTSATSLKLPAPVPVYLVRQLHDLGTPARCQKRRTMCFGQRTAKPAAVAC